ncbi:unnamed protein product [Amoebophrya sp. A25]|nr:unnamed protein product [Amoebophrya sp. A25]|eukprot:GSA25T00007526001.1
MVPCRQLWPRMDNVLRENVQSALVELWHIGVSTDEMFNECRNRLKHATKWAQQYYVPLGGVDVVAKAGGKPKPRIRHLVGNEQNVCSHRFGFKGKLDGLVRTDDANKTAALEIKTGRIRTEHVGQITVYYMLLCDLVNQQLQPELQACSSSALLLYPHKDECTYEAKRISRFDVRAIMQIRNMLASTIQRRRQTLEEGRLRGPVWPPMIPRENGMEPSDCKRCFRKDHCYTLAASVENQPQLRPELDSRVRAYIQKWLMVIDAEEVLGAKAKERPWRTNTTLNRDKAPNVVNPSSAQQGVQKAVDGAAPEAKVKDQDAKEGGSGSSGLRYLKFEEAVLVKPSNHPNMFGVNNSEEHQFHWIFSVPDSEAAAKLQAFSSGGPRSSQLDFEDYAVASAKPKKKNAGGPFGSGTSEAALSMRALTLGADENAAKASNTTKQQQELAGSQPSPELVQSILSLPFTVGDQITISREPEGPFSLFQATVVNIDCEGRRVTVRPRTEIRATLRSDAGAQMCTTQLTDIEDLQRAAGVASAQQLSTCEFYRMDKDEYGGGFAKIRGDLMQLVCTQELMNPFVGKIKRKLIFLEPPTFSDVELGEQVGTTVMPKTPPEMIAEGTNCLTQWQRMNLTQQNVIRRCFQADDYCVVQGFPGTGKTEVLASLLELYVRNGKRVLFCAYTNAAVDNGLLRLLRNASEAGKRPMQIVRLGSNEQKVHNEVRPYLLQNRNLNSIQDVNGFIQSVQLVACTLLGCHDALVQHLAFDLVVVDEASQATEPATWCALFKTRKFVLFGDTNQLQPLVKHPKAIQFGLQRSLMERLSEEQPACVAELNVQYRMNEEIQKLPNKLIYNGKLVCGSDAVKYRKLTAYTLGDVTTKEGWLRAALDPDRKVVFLDTMDSLPEDMASRQENQGEANLCQELVRSLLSLGLFEADIGVLSPYRRQLALIKEVLGPERPEVLTVDEAQGKDKKCVIVSLVKSNRERKVGQLLTDWRRMNVLLTRAQCKLVLIGSVPTLHTNELMRNMLETCHDNAWIVPVSR